MTASGTGRVVVVGLGPAGADLVTLDTARRIAAADRVFLRTGRHPAASVAVGATTFDALYERAEDFDQVYAAIVEALVAEASRHGDVLYAVPGSPLVAERTVELLLADERVEVQICPALSFLDLSWVRLGIDPLREGVRIVDGHRFREDAAGDRGPLLVAQCHSVDVLSDIKLSLDPPAGAEPNVTILHHLGLSDEVIVRVPWSELDRTVAADHLTSLYIPRLGTPVAAALVDIVALVRRLRDECPWDAQQTHASLSGYVIEEAYELVDAIGALGLLGEPDQRGDGVVLNAAGSDAVDHFCEELGDVLFQVLFHACLAAEAGWFELGDVASTLHDKLVRRHPHVFNRSDFDTREGEYAVASADDVVRNWDTIKRGERSDDRAANDPFASIPSSLPALIYAAKLLKRAAPFAEAQSAASEHLDEKALGEVLLGLVAAAQRDGVDAEIALRRAVARVREHAIRTAG